MTALVSSCSGSANDDASIRRPAKPCAVAAGGAARCCCRCRRCCASGHLAAAGVAPDLCACLEPSCSPWAAPQAALGARAATAIMPQPRRSLPNVKVDVWVRMPCALQALLLSSSTCASRAAHLLWRPGDCQRRSKADLHNHRRLTSMWDGVERDQVPKALLRCSRFAPTAPCATLNAALHPISPHGCDTPVCRRASPLPPPPLQTGGPPCRRICFASSVPTCYLPTPRRCYPLPARG